MKMPKKASTPNKNERNDDDNNNHETIPQTPPPNPNRCQFETSDGRRCRMLRYNAHPTLCLFHAHDEMQLLESQPIGAELSASLTGQFMTATDINFVLGKLFTATAQNRIPPRTAAILAYLGQLMLHSLHHVKKEYPFTYKYESWNNMLNNSIPLSRSWPARPSAAPAVAAPAPAAASKPAASTKASAPSPAAASKASTPSTAQPSTPTTSLAPATAPQASTPTTAPAPTTAPKPSAPKTASAPANPTKASAPPTAPPSTPASTPNLSNNPQRP